MQISELISILEEIKSTDGDLVVKLNNSDFGALSDLWGLGIGYNIDDELYPEESEDSEKVVFISY